MDTRATPGRPASGPGASRTEPRSADVRRPAYCVKLKASVINSVRAATSGTSVA